jgi:hypothetical protein
MLNFFNVIDVLSEEKLHHISEDRRIIILSTAF